MTKSNSWFKKASDALNMALKYWGHGVDGKDPKDRQMIKVIQKALRQAYEEGLADTSVETERQRLAKIVDKLPKTADGAPAIIGEKYWHFGTGDATSDLLYLGEWDPRKPELSLDPKYLWDSRDAAIASRQRINRRRSMTT